MKNFEPYGLLLLCNHSPFLSKLRQSRRLQVFSAGRKPVRDQLAERCLQFAMRVKAHLRRIGRREGAFFSPRGVFAGLLAGGITIAILAPREAPAATRNNPTLRVRPPRAAVDSPTMTRYNPSPVQRLAPPTVAPTSPDHSLRGLRDLANRNQMQEFQSQAATRGSAKLAANPAPPKPPSPGAVVNSGSLVSTRKDGKKRVSFGEAPADATFYFPNDLERRYRWVKVSPTLARNLVNGRTATLAPGAPLILAGSQFFVFAPAPAQVDYPQPSTPGSTMGRNTLRIRNPNEYTARINMRSGDQDFTMSVAAHDTGSVRLPDGTYRVFFQFSDRPGRRFQGEDVTLHGNIAEIQLVSVAGGNYELRAVD